MQINKVDLFLPFVAIPPFWKWTIHSKHSTLIQGQILFFLLLSKTIVVFKGHFLSTLF